MGFGPQRATSTRLVLVAFRYRFRLLPVPGFLVSGRSRFSDRMLCCFARRSPCRRDARRHLVDTSTMDPLFWDVKSLRHL